MKITKFLNYFNLIVAIVLLWTYLKSIPLFYDYFFIAGLAMTIWYNWYTLKRIIGQTTFFGRVNYVIGLLTIVFGVLLTAWSIMMIKGGLQNERMHVVLGIIYMPLGFTTIWFTSITLKYHRVS